MRTFDFTPLFRHSVGFDRMQHLMDNAARQDSTNSYPPYNIEQINEDGYQITMALAGFSENDLDVSVEENTLVVKGTLHEETDGVTYLHRGIAGRAFERRFQLADHIKVDGGSLINGLLKIDLVREIPEEKKPRKVSIGTKAKAITNKKAA